MTQPQKTSEIDAKADALYAKTQEIAQDLQAKNPRIKPKEAFDQAWAIVQAAHDAGQAKEMAALKPSPGASK